MSESMSDRECAMPTVEQLLGPVVRTEEEMITAEGLGSTARMISSWRTDAPNVGELLAHGVTCSFADRGWQVRCTSAIRNSRNESLCR